MWMSPFTYRRLEPVTHQVPPNNHEDFSSLTGPHWSTASPSSCCSPPANRALKPEPRWPRSSSGSRSITATQFSCHCLATYIIIRTKVLYEVNNRMQREQKLDCVAIKDGIRRHQQIDHTANVSIMVKGPEHTVLTWEPTNRMTSKSPSNRIQLVCNMWEYFMQTFLHHL